MDCFLTYGPQPIIVVIMRGFKRCSSGLEREPLELVLARAQVARAAVLLHFRILGDPLRVEVL
jgi:hypothetical protein